MGMKIRIYIFGIFFDNFKFNVYLSIRTFTKYIFHARYIKTDDCILKMLPIHRSSIVFYFVFNSLAWLRPA